MTEDTTWVPRVTPKLIHTTWVQGEPPAKYKPLVESWVRNNPDYTVRVWNQDMFLAEVATDKENGITIVPDKFMDYFHAITRMSERMDAMRIYIMKKYGGVHVDMDMECVSSITKQLGSTIKNPIMCKFICNSSLMNMVLASEPDCFFTVSPAGHPMWDHAIKMTEWYVNKTSIGNGLIPAGSALRDAYKDVDFRNKYNITLCADDLIVRDESAITKNTLAIHEHHATWNEGFSAGAILYMRDSPYAGIVLMLLIVICIIVVAFVISLIIKPALARRKLLTMNVT
jgi:hypothetical protein